MGAELKEILVIGGTGAQGIPIVKELSQSNRYSVRVLTRDPRSQRAKALASLPNVTLLEGTQDNQQHLHAAFKGVYGAFVNTDGFTIGEKNELFYGIRAYEIARYEGVKHYIYGNSDYALKKAGWDEEYHWGHNDAKGRVGDFILAQDQTKMKSSLLTVGPYMDMLFDGMYVPKEDPDGTVAWENPGGQGKIPLQALEDVGHYVLWMLDNPDRSTGMDLEVTTDQVSFNDIASTFTRVTGRKAVHRYVPFEIYLPKSEPYPNAPASWANPKAPRDESLMTWRENFTPWWKYWAGGFGATRDIALLDEIHPNRIKTLEGWMRRNDYQGKPKNILKGLEDLRSTLSGDM